MAIGVRTGAEVGEDIVEFLGGPGAGQGAPGLVGTGCAPYVPHDVREQVPQGASTGEAMDGGFGTPGMGGITRDARRFVGDLSRDVIEAQGDPGCGVRVWGKRLPGLAAG